MSAFISPGMFSERNSFLKLNPKGLARILPSHRSKGHPCHPLRPAGVGEHPLGGFPCRNLAKLGCTEGRGGVQVPQCHPECVPMPRTARSQQLLAGCWPREGHHHAMLRAVATKSSKHRFLVPQRLLAFPSHTSGCCLSQRI